MPVWTNNPYYDEDLSAITPLGPERAPMPSPLSPGRNDGPDDPPESGAPENSAEGGLSIFDYDWGGQQYDPDLQRMGRLYQDLYGSAPPTGIYDPAEVNYDPIRSALQQATEAERRAIDQSRRRQREELQRRQFQTLWNTFGPEVFNLASGAGVNTGFERSLAMQHQAEQRARELDQQSAQAKADLQADLRTRLAELEMQEQQTNAERERQALRQEYENEQQRREGMLGAIGSLTQTQSQRDAAEAELAVERQGQEREYQEQLRQDTVDLIAELDDDPQLAPQVAAQIQALNPDLSDQEVKAQVGQLLRASQQGQLNPEQAASKITAGGASNPLSLTDSLVTKTLQLKKEYDNSDGWLWGRSEDRPASSTASGREGNYIQDLESRRQALVYQLGRAANEAEKRAYELQKIGVQVPNETMNQIAALNTAREKLSDMTVSEGEDADTMENILAPLSTSLSSLTAGASQPQSDPLRSNPATAPYIAAFEGEQPAQGADAESGGGIVSDMVAEAQSDPALRRAMEDAERAREIAQRSREIREGGDVQPSPDAPSSEDPGEGLVRVSADELVGLAESTDPADMELAVANLLREQGVDVDGDQVPIVAVEDDGEARTVAGLEQIAQAAQEMQDAESKMQVLRNFGRPFQAIYEDIVTDDDHRLSPKRTLRVRYGVQPGDEVKLQEIGGGRAILIVNGQPQSPMPVQEARNRLSEIRTLRARIGDR
jgi:hypothetical protein